MKRRLARSIVLIFAVAGLALGIQSLAAGAKLPKCAAVKCRDIGCPADVVCVSGSKVLTCAEVCAH